MAVRGTKVRALSEHPLRVARSASGMTLEEVAAAIGVTRAAVCSWELRAYRPRPEQVSKLCELFPSLTFEVIYREPVRKAA
jgi:DNA-binding XRE family transcriptional regulator